MNQIQIGNALLPLVEYQAQRVVTFAMIDQAHERPKNTAQRNFQENRHRFIEGEDFYMAPSSANQEFRSFGISIPNRGLIVLTQVGYMMIVKSLNDDLAWRVQREMAKGYFAKPRLGAVDGEAYAALANRIEEIALAVNEMRPLIVAKFTRKKHKEAVKLTPELRALMKAMFIDGLSQTEIVDRTKSSHAAVSYAVRCVKEAVEGGVA